MATRKEEFKINGEDLIKKVKELVAQGNVRRIIIKNKDGKSLIEVPLSFGVAGMAALAVVAPALAAVGAIAALVTECSIVVEREDGPVEGPTPSEAGITPDVTKLVAKNDSESK
jgi:uncharacterized membrane protein